MTRSLYCGLGLQTSIYHFSDVANGGIISTPLSLYWFSSSEITLRASIAPGWGKSSRNDIEVNFQQPRYIHGVLSGSRTFITDNSSRFQFPITLDLLMAPGKQEMFNIIFGGGVYYEKETMQGMWSDTEKDDKVEYTSWEPQLRTGFGFMIPNSVGATFIEFNLNALKHDDSGKTPTISNNSETSVQFGASLSLLF